ncbi:putative HNH endonuclease protein [Rhizobium phage RHph_N28_1]|nr:putative HNH endonuclease protein [Rhizobium phage RHph_N28_1]QIG74279.1 putative HNH endonuclease protein [Rhizobium phage RHph_N42]QIG74888.1 putative HNH endonuclease protein [Rhizobium phage RHph_I42]QXV73939.1 putative HNH endonuclease protein [Rhizobium phage RHph_N46]
MIGQRFETSAGPLKVLDCIDSRNCTVRFLETGSVRYGIAAGNIRKGTVKDFMRPSVYGVGYVGEGDYPPKGKLYRLWTAMLQRCYDEKFQKVGYVGCSVVKRWHNFQTFCADIVAMPNWDKPGFELDKDLRVLGNKKYGPKYCSFVPQAINAIMRGNNKGYSKCKDGPMYESKLRMDGKLVHLGRFRTAKAARATFLLRKQRYVNRKVRQFETVLHPEVIATLRNITASSRVI